MDEKNLKDVILEGYKRRLRHFEMEKKVYDIVIAGDSMAAYLNVHHYFKNVNIMNQGIPGDTTEGLFNRIEYIVKVSPKIIFLNIGSNDLVLLHKTPQEIIDSIIKIINHLKQKLSHIKIYVFNVTPVNEMIKNANQLYIFGRKNEDIQEINHLLSLNIPHSMLINIYDHLIDEHNHLKPSLTYDGIHLNDSGYEIYTTRMKEYL